MAYLRPDILAMPGYLPGEQPQGGKFIKLNTNENPYPPSPTVLTAIEQAARQGLARYPDPLANAFRRQAARVLGISAESILCGNGSDDILTIVTRAFVGAGAALRMPYPSYILYRTLAQLQGARCDEFHFNRDWSLRPDFADVPADVRLAVIPNPNSPSGTMVAPARLLDLARQLPCPLLIDEAYADFADENCLSLVNEDERIMVSRSFSKSYALAGLRFGYLVAQPHIIEQLVKVKDSYNCDTLAISGATAAIADQIWLTDNRAKILRDRQRLSSGLTQLGFQVVASQANFVWGMHAHYPSHTLYEQLKAKQILVRYMNFTDWGDGLRISVGTSEQIDALLHVIGSIVSPGAEKSPP